MQKRNSRHIRRQEKVSLLFLFKHMKVIQDALLSNKIECYNKGVQRSPSLSAKGYTHSSRHLHRSKYKIFERALKKGCFFHWIMSQMISVETTECWLHHDAWCKYWRSLSPIENNWLLKWKNNQRVKKLPCSLWLKGRVHEEECDESFSVFRLITKNCARFLIEKRMERRRWLKEKLQL